MPSVRRVLAYPFDLIGASMPLVVLTVGSLAMFEHRLDHATTVSLGMLLSTHPVWFVAGGLIDPHPDRVARWFLRPLRFAGLMLAATVAYAWWVGR